MSEDEIEIDIDDLQRRMDGAHANLRTEFASLRTGRASASMLDPLMVEAYGSMTPINQLGTVNVPEPRMVTLNIWDKSMVGKVEKAIRASGLGINPVVDGTIIRLPIPALSEERRRELVKTVKQIAEETRVRIRSSRRDGMEALKKGEKEGKITEDDLERCEKEVQKLTDDYVKKVDDSFASKEADIMKV